MLWRGTYAVYDENARVFQFNIYTHMHGHVQWNMPIRHSLIILFWYTRIKTRSTNETSEPFRTLWRCVFKISGALTNLPEQRKLQSRTFKSDRFYSIQRAAICHPLMLNRQKWTTNEIHKLRLILIAFKQTHSLNSHFISLKITWTCDEKKTFHRIHFRRIV